MAELVQHWDIIKTTIYKCLFNFIVGARGVGKTYGCKQWAIEDFIKHKNQFIYVRRYKEELKDIKKFFDDIASKFPEHEFKVDGKKFIIDGEEAGEAIPLSIAKIKKSTPYPNVTKIIFDEFIIDKGVYHYLPDEVTNFLELYSTIARDRDVIVYFLSNALTFTNPYFIYFNLRKPYGKKDIVVKDDILLQIVQASVYEEHMRQTRFGKLIAGTPYGNYAMANDFLRDDNNFVQHKTVKSKYLFTMIYNGNEYGVWEDYNEGLIFVSKDVDNSNPFRYSMTMADHSPNALLLKGTRVALLDHFIKGYKMGVVRFESIQIKNICNDIIKMTL